MEFDMEFTERQLQALASVQLFSYSDEAFAMTPTEKIKDMFSATDENGILFIREWPYDYPPDYDYKKPQYFRCVMNWSDADVASAIAAYEKLYADIKQIAALQNSAGAKTGAVPLPEELPAFWNTYLRPFDTGDMGEDVIADIRDRKGSIYFAQRLGREIRAGEKLSENYIATYEKLKDTVVTAEEEALDEQYRQTIRQDAARRIGDRPGAYEVIYRAQRLYGLLAQGEPDDIAQGEAYYLAQAMVIHTYCSELQLVDEVE